MTILNDVNTDKCDNCSHYKGISTNLADEVDIGECQCKMSDHYKHIIGSKHPACRYFT